MSAGFFIIERRDSRIAPDNSLENKKSLSRHQAEAGGGKEIKKDSKIMWKIGGSLGGNSEPQKVEKKMQKTSATQLPPT